MKKRIFASIFLFISLLWLVSCIREKETPHETETPVTAGGTTAVTTACVTTSATTEQQTDPTSPFPAVTADPYWTGTDEGYTPRY